MLPHHNPVCEGADPFLLLSGGVYYHYATSAPDGFLVHRSADLVHWENCGYCLRRGDAAGERNFWAPEVIRVGGSYHMIYTADTHLAVATASSPLGPFRQSEPGFLSERDAIDGSFFVDTDGAVYLYYVRFDGGNIIYGTRLCSGTEEIACTLRIGAETRLIEPEAEWETRMGRVAEGPFMLKHGGKYYLTYSANDYRSQDYAVGYAVADTPLGPFCKYTGSPILRRAGGIVGTGHHSFCRDADGELLCVYHCHRSDTEIHPRQTCVDRAEFVPAPDAGADRLVICGPTA